MGGIGRVEGANLQHLILPAGWAGHQAEEVGPVVGVGGIGGVGGAFNIFYHLLAGLDTRQRRWDKW